MEVMNDKENAHPISRLSASNVDRHVREQRSQEQLNDSECDSIYSKKSARSSGSNKRRNTKLSQQLQNVLKESHKVTLANSGLPVAKVATSVSAPDPSVRARSRRRDNKDSISIKTLEGVVEESPEYSSPSSLTVPSVTPKDVSQSDPNNLSYNANKTAAGSRIVLSKLRKSDGNVEVSIITLAFCYSSNLICVASNRCLNACPTIFYWLESIQYCMLLYYLKNRILQPRCGIYLFGSWLRFM